MFGIAWLCAAAFAHFHFFWPHRNRTLCAYGKAAALVIGMVTLYIAMIAVWTGQNLDGHVQ